MAAPQTSVSATQTVAYAGMLGDLNAVKYTRSYVNEEASAQIPFGVMVKKGTDMTKQAKVLATGDALSDLLGIVVHRHDYAKDTELGTTGLKPGVALEVLRKGVIWVPVEEAVTPASATVYVRIIAAGEEVAGAFRDSTDASDLLNISICARFLSTTTGAGLALLEIDMTNVAA